MANFHSNDSKLFKLIIRRERINSPIWIACLVGLTLAVTATFTTGFATDAERQAMIATVENPAMIAMLGPVYGTDNYTIGAMFTNMMLLFTILGVCFMNIFFVDRHTRRDEERGRVEVIRSLPVSRLANLRVTMEAALVLNALIALLTGVGLWTLQIESMTLNGALLYGAALGVSGLLFAAITALCAQLCTTSRGVIAYAMFVMFIMYILRGVGDIRSETLSRIIPLGLILRTQAFTANVWWPVFVVLVTAIAVTILAFYLDSIRDMGQGFIPAKPGRKTASALLTTSIGLSWRLVRMPFIAWLFGSFFLGASYGSVMGDIESFIKGNDMLMAAIGTVPGHSIVELFITMLMSIMAIVSTIPVLTVMLKLVSEEKHHRVEPILTRTISRMRLMSSYFVLAVITSIVIMVSTIAGLWMASSAVMKDPIAWSSMFEAMMVYLPAVLIMLGLAVFLIGWFPRYTGIAWGYLGFSLFVVYIGRLMQLPDWIRKTAPYSHIPEIPVDTIHWPTLWVLTGIAIVFIVLGFIGYRKRDMIG